ncbi:hypothetical protein N7445_004754 [Penicillium cf. griseofulvum]|nr:hypothetical protein N7445_004754 [Penicillium cf. griseofulvum]
MPTTRNQSSKQGLPLLHGLTEEKRIRKPKPAGSNGPSIPAVPKGKRKAKGKGNNLQSPHAALAAALLERGADFKFPERTKQIRGQRVVWGPREVPITDPTKLPDGWSVDEPDLDEADIDNQIARCKERILEKIMPHFFDSRMETLTAIKKQQMDMIKSEPGGLSWEIVQRLDSLKMLETNLQAEDKDDNLSNVKAIIAAYRSKKLDWDGKSVTYWSKGGLINGPKKLDMKELYALSGQYGPKGFWVEGIWIALRNPTTQATSTMATTMTFDFLEDTGSSSMRVFADDIAKIETLSGAPVPVLGQALKQTASGQVMVQTVVLQANIIHNGQHLLPYWVDIQTSVSSGTKGPQGDRLSGVWIYHLLFVLSMPDGTRAKHFGTDIREMVSNLPIPDYKNARPPPFI